MAEPIKIIQLMIRLNKRPPPSFRTLVHNCSSLFLNLFCTIYYALLFVCFLQVWGYLSDSLTPLMCLVYPFSTKLVKRFDIIFQIFLILEGYVGLIFAIFRIFLQGIRAKFLQLLSKIFGQFLLGSVTSKPNRFLVRLYLMIKSVLRRQPPYGGLPHRTARSAVRNACLRAGIVPTTVGTRQAAPHMKEKTKREKAQQGLFYSIKLNH